jgi:hypothetical protein
VDDLPVNLLDRPRTGTITDVAHPSPMSSLLKALFPGYVRHAEQLVAGPDAYGTYGFRVPAVIVSPYARSDCVLSDIEAGRGQDPPGGPALAQTPDQRRRLRPPAGRRPSNPQPDQASLSHKEAFDLQRRDITGYSASFFLHQIEASGGNVFSGQPRTMVARRSRAAKGAAYGQRHMNLGPDPCLSMVTMCILAICPISSR